MATVRLYLDTRRAKKNGEYPIKIVVFHNKDIMIGTPFTASKSEWVNNQYIRSVPNYRAKNAGIAALKLKIESIILELERKEILHTFSDKELKNKLEEGDAKKRAPSFLQIYNEFAESRTAQRTRDIYLDTLNKIESFDRRVTFDKINLRWLDNFDEHLEDNGASVNTRSIHMRNIRAVFNYALDHELTTNYPFRKFKIKSERTRHRNLYMIQLQQLMMYDGKWNAFRDCFMLSFYLCGINLVDLLHAKKADVVKGRLEYRRRKTKKLYSIKIEPEAWDIINRYPDDEYLVSFIRIYKSYDGFKRGINYSLKKITDQKGNIIDAGLSSYYARHTWASVAASLDIPKETISVALGHEIGSSVTSIYINFDQVKVDKANRKIIDAINKGMPAHAHTPSPHS